MTADLRLGDCLDVLRQMPDACVDLTVTSPPYDNLRTYNGFTFDFEGIARELYRVTKPGGVVVWVVGDATIKGSETGSSFRQALFFKDVCGFNLHDTMIYKTNKPPITGPRYQSDFEYMFVLSKGAPRTANLLKEATLHPGVLNRGGMRDKSGEMGERTTRNRTGDEKVRGNIWYIPRSSRSGDTHSRRHPATFPDGLARDHIASWSNPGDVVLDPFLGSGTTGKMAVQMGRQFIGIEISAEYLEIARNRISGAKQAA